jgi:DNA (cytosine-5)-methyltransferase 1
MNYYNENDPFAAQWLRELIKAEQIPQGEVDERSIVDVKPADLIGYTQHHFFAGIGGWSYALRLAGWPDDQTVWTGSCPCQPISSAARGRLVAEDQWPAFQSLIYEYRPSIIFGEQVPKRWWIARAIRSLEDMGYRTNAANISALCAGADHKRERVYFAGYANSYRKSIVPVNGKVEGMPRDRSLYSGVVHTDGLPSRMAVLRGFGNAIVPQVAQTFIEAYMQG